ncbi:carbohydrate kinase [Alteribacillus sp. HJP-4]|uniref:carbohydrate kinase family protein n=1 Tax=Alteribacillus sp. HJP-4 TaxID=2775394 RepID=UPI0035CCE492
MKKGVISLGEALIDFIPMDRTNSVFQKNPGGAPANVAVGLSRLGIETYFAGKIGDDVLGRFLLETLTEYGVNTSAVSLTTETRTGVVFVTLGEGGERSFDFYIKPSADQKLEAGEVREALFHQCKILHFGSITLINEPARSATLHAIDLAKKYGMTISFDPNVRLPLWPNEKAARTVILDTLSSADIVKISEDELSFLTGEAEEENALEQLKSFHIPVLVVTKGAEGSTIITKDGRIDAPADKVNAVDTTGAGDAYVSGLLYQIHESRQDPRDIGLDQWEEFAAFASVSGGLAASEKGAMSALPRLTDIENRKLR